MTSTAPALPSDLGPEIPMDKLVTEAEGHGRDHGRGLAEWMEITSESDARHLLRLIEDVDPLKDAYDPSAPFSGEFVDDKQVRDLIEDDLELDPDSVTPEEEDELVSAYERAYYGGYWERLEERARAYVVDCDRERESELLAIEADLG